MLAPYPSLEPLKIPKKRKSPGNPNPDSEVIALSPKTLMTANRFVCDICKKGFQRDQNLQLHRRGHNLPWKLKLKDKNESTRKKVYVCPVSNCIHHDPLKALGDLTGIKKHFSRKHGEKQFQCEKCPKSYAVLSDLKAHSKVCGTKEYACQCGSIFARKDSFNSHRAFCDALIEEGVKIPYSFTKYNNSSDLQISPPPPPPQPPSSDFYIPNFSTPPALDNQQVSPQQPHIFHTSSWVNPTPRQNPNHNPIPSNHNHNSPIFSCPKNNSPIFSNSNTDNSIFSKPITNHPIFLNPDTNNPIFSNPNHIVSNTNPVLSNTFLSLFQQVQPSLTSPFTHHTQVTTTSSSGPAGDHIIGHVVSSQSFTQEYPNPAKWQNSDPWTRDFMGLTRGSMNNVDDMLPFTRTVEFPDRDRFFLNTNRAGFGYYENWGGHGNS
ncbi:hypothetical protein GIB67_040030 [Kingdonia uniflora]|uniref:C2H2-type domain-containing protein n=1 Tax=Kingdonia uniflora TaxID=39325 RepID=A0A7J7MUE8_9MAGN|nr:hypothetical protein GIB67_040030 [Kingdonia uniflora]